VVDQVALGGVGVLATQALAAGRVVVGSLASSVRWRHPEPPPVVNADPSTLAEVILDIATRREHYYELAAQGPVFARRWHDGAASAQVLADHFLLKASR
jgi:hypothetical protein